MRRSMLGTGVRVQGVDDVCSCGCHFFAVENLHPKAGAIREASLASLERQIRPHTLSRVGGYTKSRVKVVYRIRKS